MDLVRSGERAHVSGMSKLRALVLVGVVAAFAPTLALPRDAGEGTEGAHGFDFEFGDWNVHHRLQRANGEWWEFDGTCSDRALMGGASNVEEHIFTKPSGVSYGVALRTYDAEQN